MVEKRVVDYYAEFYPSHTKKSIEKILNKVKKKYGRLDAITVAHFIRQSRKTKKVL